LFIAEDGVNLQLSGALGIIDNIKKCFNLNKNTCAVFCREKLELGDVTVISESSILCWASAIYSSIKDIPIPSILFSKKFACWFNRGTFFRLHIARHLDQKYNQDSYILYRERGMISDVRLSRYFLGDLDWSTRNTPIVVNDDGMWVEALGMRIHTGSDYFIEVIVEADPNSSTFITEKTIKNLYIGKPFLTMCGVGCLEYIRSHGFKTFSPWINEEYDLIENTYLRLEAIKQEIDRIASIPMSELKLMYQEMIPIFEHNRQVYIDLVKN
jgi:hypothetical protein